MKYKEILNNIYSNYKKNDKYELDNNIKFYKENNTNIVKFELYDNELKNITGFLVEQNHLIIIYFKINDGLKEQSLLSKAHIILGHRAIIYNCLLSDSIEYQETIGRDFKNRKDIYKFNSKDVVIEDNMFDEEFENIIQTIDNQNYQKIPQKRLKI